MTVRVKEERGGAWGLGDGEELKHGRICGGEEMGAIDRLGDRGTLEHGGGGNGCLAPDGNPWNASKPRQPQRVPGT